MQQKGPGKVARASKNPKCKRLPREETSQWNSVAPAAKPQVVPTERPARDIDAHEAGSKTRMWLSPRAQSAENRAAATRKPRAISFRESWYPLGGKRR